MKNKLLTFLVFIILTITLSTSLFFLAQSKKNKSVKSINLATVNVWLTTPDRKNLLKQQQSVRFEKNETEQKIPTITIYDKNTHQKIDGFGASMTDTSAYLINGIPNNSIKNQLMENLFSKDNGIGINFLRQPIGSSDFALSFYTYDDLPSKNCPGKTEDPDLNCFSIKHDLDYIVPLLKQAQTLNRNIKIMATPWSPPAWMKTNNSLVGKTKNGGSLIPKYYGTYANYFVRFLKTYKELGINIFAISIQNEPGFLGNYPGMNFKASEQLSFIKTYLLPTLNKENFNPKLLIFDYNFDSKTPGFNSQNFDSFMSVFKNVKTDNIATAIHCYGEIPDKTLVTGDLYLTECATSITKNYATSSANPLSPIDLIIDALRHGSKTAVFWNIAEDQNNGPRPEGNSKGCQKCTPLVTIKTDGKGKPTNNISFNTEYYALGHVGKFVMRDAYFIDSTQPSPENTLLKNVAFKNPDGTVVLIVHNTDPTSTHKLKVKQNGKSFDYTLPAGAIVTFKW